MRIALVVTGGVDQSGREAVIPALLWLIERLARRHDVHVYALRYLDRPCSYPLLGATVHDLGRPEGLVAQTSALIRRLRGDGPFDVVHAYWALPAGLAASLAATWLGVPAVVTMDSGEFVADSTIDYGLQLRWQHRVAVWVVRKLASRLTVCTEYQAKLARSHGAIALIVPLGVDRRVFRRGHRPEGPPWRLVHVANLNRVKDQTMLLEALRRLVTLMPNVTLDIVGTDTLGGTIQALAKQLHLESQVTFHGFLPTDDLVAIYQRAHLAILTSRHEAAGVVVLEAAACGVATIGTPVGYIADWAPFAAVTVDRVSPETLATAAADLLSNRDKRERIAAAAHERALTYDADWTARTFEELYGAVIPSPAR